MRLAVAGQRAVDERQADAVFSRSTGSFSERHRAALALADAMMTLPGSLSDADAAALAAWFTPDQLVELTVDIMKWNYQKVMVALGTHPEVKPGELVDLIFDENGHWVRPS